MSLGDDYELLEEELVKVNDQSPDEETSKPDEDKLSAEEFKAQMLAYEKEQGKLKEHIAQIKRWFKYQNSKTIDMITKDAHAKNPYTAMLHAITGVGLAKPQKPQVFALWAKDNTEAIKNEQSQVTTGKQQAGSLNSIKSSLFKALTEEEQQAWEIKAQMEFEAAEKEYQKKLNSPYSSDPADMQRCQDLLPDVVQPFINMVAKATGCPVFFVFGGPKPGDRGRLSITS